MKKTVLPLLLVISLFFMPQAILAKDASPDSATLSYDALLGEWQRTDGSYSLKVSAVQATGDVRVDYFNPKPIHIAEAAVSTQEGLIKLFIKFQDQGYEGSSYRLYYYTEKDALAGFYYHGVLDRTYEVIFFRKNN